MKYPINSLVAFNKLGQEKYASISNAILKVKDYIIDDKTYIVELVDLVDEGIKYHQLLVDESNLRGVKHNKIEVSDEQIEQLNKGEITMEDIINDSLMMKDI